MTSFCKFWFNFSEDYISGVSLKYDVGAFEMPMQEEESRGESGLNGLNYALEDAVLLRITDLRSM